jgi:hypothetical protein
MENKVTVIAKDGVARIGSDFHVLEDESSYVFETDSVEDFKKYVVDSNVPDTRICFTYGKAIAFNPEEAHQTSRELAVLKLSEHALLGVLSNVILKKQSLEQMEEFLMKMRPYLDDNGLFLLSNIRDFRVSKILKIERQKTKNANYTYHISRQSAADDFTPPEKIAFIIPIYNHIAETVRIEMEVLFDFSEVEDDNEKKSVETVFTLFNYQFTEHVQWLKKEITTRELNTLAFEKFWGDVSLNKATDSWKYQKNGVQ